MDRSKTPSFKDSLNFKLFNLAYLNIQTGYTFTFSFNKVGFEFDQFLEVIRSVENLNLRSFPLTLVLMDKNIENCDLNAKFVGGKDKRTNRCNQCEYASIHASNLRSHLKTHRKKVKQMQSV